MTNFNLRRANAFELILLVVGVSIGVVGFIMINRLYLQEGALTWNVLLASFIWLMLIIQLILTATMEDVKEELAVIIKEHVNETRLLRELERDTLNEIKLLREDFKGHKIIKK